MQTEPQVTYVNVERSDEVDQLVLREVDQLERFYDRITACRVSIELPHRRHQTGANWHVHVVLEVPGDEIVVDREPEKDRRHERIGAAVRDAFKAARRQLQDHVQRLQAKTDRSVE
jgi:ribosome-associated translation inhibitor RaiA